MYPPKYHNTGIPAWVGILVLIPMLIAIGGVFVWLSFEQNKECEVLYGEGSYFVSGNTRKHSYCVGPDGQSYLR